LTEHTTTDCLLFPDIFDRPVVAKFDQQQGSSDGGAVLLKAANQRLGLTSALAACLKEERQPGKILHEIEELLTQRVRERVQLQGPRILLDRLFESALRLQPPEGIQMVHGRRPGTPFQRMMESSRSASPVMFPKHGNDGSSGMGISERVVSLKRLLNSPVGQRQHLPRGREREVGRNRIVIGHPHVGQGILRVLFDCSLKARLALGQPLGREMVLMVATLPVGLPCRET